MQFILSIRIITLNKNSITCNSPSISYCYHIDSVLLPLSSMLSHREVPIRLGLVCVIGLVMIDLFNVR